MRLRRPPPVSPCEDTPRKRCQRSRRQQPIMTDTDLMESPIAAIGITSTGQLSPGPNEPRARWILSGEINGDIAPAA